MKIDCKIWIISGYFMNCLIILYRTVAILFRIVEQKIAKQLRTEENGILRSAD